MADVNSVINTTELTKELSGYVLDKLSPLITIFKILGVVVLIYVIFLIIKALFRLKTAYNIGKIARNVEEINGKLDMLIATTKTKKNKKIKKGEK